MRILNAGCGNTRPGDERFVNLDTLRTQHAVGSPERIALDLEPNYVEFDMRSGPLPFDADSFDACCLLHVVEHFDAQETVAIMRDCRRILKPRGLMLVSVPDASYFRRVYTDDRNENWPELFDVSDPANPIPTFMDAALFFEQHKQVFTEDALWCCLTQAGFYVVPLDTDGPSAEAMKPLLNRRKFSLEMLAMKGVASQ